MSNSATSPNRAFERRAEDQAKEFLLALDDASRVKGTPSPMPTDWEALPDDTRRVLIHTFLQLMVQGVVNYD